MASPRHDFAETAGNTAQLLTALLSLYGVRSQEMTEMTARTMP